VEMNECMEASIWKELIFILDILLLGCNFIYMVYTLYNLK